MPQPAIKLTKPRVIAAMIEHHGNVKMMSLALGVNSPNHVHDYLTKHPELREKLADVRDELLDVAEDHIAKAIMAGNLDVVRWFLERKGRSRGYSSRYEITGSDGGPLEFSRIERVIVDPLTIEADYDRID